MTETEGEKKNHGHGGKRTENRRKEKGPKREEHPPFRWVSCGGDFYYKTEDILRFRTNHKGFLSRSTKTPLETAKDSTADPLRRPLRCSLRRPLRHPSPSPPCQAPLQDRASFRWGDTA